MATLEHAVSGGVSFALTEEQKALRQLARDSAGKEVRPMAAQYDAHSTHAGDVIAKAHQVGLISPHVPEEYGGIGLPAFDGMLVGEELSWGCSGIAVSIVANTLGAGPVLLAGIKEYPVEKLMRGAKLFQIYERTSQMQRLVIAREIFLPSGP
jgi:acyl-CoA dehydrogenase